MAKFLVVLCLLCAAATNALNALEDVKVEVEVVSSADLKDVLKQYPNAVEMQRRVHTEKDVAKDDATPRLVNIEYFTGARVSGDFIVGGPKHQLLTFHEPKDIEMTVTYPPVGQNGYIVSYASVLVWQDQLGGRGYVVDGGVGKRYIKMIIEAYQTYYFEALSTIYGY